jgi:hypothetical protein
MLRYARPTRDLDPHERFLAGIVRLAVRDAQEGRNEILRQEALRWLWNVAPTVAERAQLPRGIRGAPSMAIAAERMPDVSSSRSLICHLRASLESLHTHKKQKKLR